MLPKGYVVKVLANSLQSNRIMDVPGYSHFGQPQKDFLGRTICEVFFYTPLGKTFLQEMIAETLADAYNKNLNQVKLS